MEGRLLDIDFVQFRVVDNFTSFIWTERHNVCGDFELSATATPDLLAAFSAASYVTIEDSNRAMIAESVNLQNGTKGPGKITLKGRSIEFLLDRRIVWGQIALKGNLQTEIQRLLNENAISPTDSVRVIPNLVFTTSTNPDITSLTINTQYTGESLYKVITEVCLAAGIGFKVTMDRDLVIRFELVSGVDRSYSQTSYPYVVFSPEFDNLISSDWTSETRKKNVALVEGEKGVGNKSRLTPAGELSATGLARDEIYVKASGANRKVGETTLNDTQYDALLVQKGEEGIAKERGGLTKFEGQADATIIYVYGQDFVMGDIVQVEDEFGHESRSQVTELIRSQDIAGFKIYPTFAAAS
jgi:hypothetical protein